VKNVPEEINISSYDGLLVEEVMRCERYAGVVWFWDGAEDFGGAHGGQVLHDELQFGIVLGDGEGYVALGSSELAPAD
jgi:hypothetical protein